MVKEKILSDGLSMTRSRGENTFSGLLYWGYLGDKAENLKKSERNSSSDSDWYKRRYEIMLK